MANWVKVHPLVVRITHWINALAILVMVASGWRIYNASPLFESFTFPEALTLGGWLAGALQWHFAAMWLLALNGLVYVVYWDRLRPLSPQAPADLPRSGAARHLAGPTRPASARGLCRLQRRPAAPYLWCSFLRSSCFSFTGLAIGKPVQLQELAALMGGYEGARLPPLLRHVARRFHRRGARRHGRARAAHLPDHDHRALRRSS
jgi:hypothetical protein